MVEVGHELGAMFIKGDRMTENSDRRVVSNEVKLFVSYADGCNRIPSALLDKIDKGARTIVPDADKIDDHVSLECAFIYSAILYSIFVVWIGSYSVPPSCRAKVDLPLTYILHANGICWVLSGGRRPTRSIIPASARAV